MKDTITKWRVEYECVIPSSSWGMTPGATNVIGGFDSYDLRKFQAAAPGNWEIRKIERYEVVDR